jgi:hypothetical protein
MAGVFDNEIVNVQYNRIEVSIRTIWEEQKFGFVRVQTHFVGPEIVDDFLKFNVYKID